MKVLVIGAGGIFAVAFPVGFLPIASAARDTAAPPRMAQAHAVSPPARPTDGAGPLYPAILPPAVKTRLTNKCRPASAAGDYVDPLAAARVTSERIDQGVDYAGSGTIAAMGAATVTYVARTGTGWPGSFIEYRLLDGPEAGCYVYYAEGVNPAPGLHVGERVAAGKPLASIIPGWSTGIELGWGAGISTVTYAARTHQWNPTSDQASIASAAGKSFSALIASLGGPPGKVEG